MDKIAIVEFKSRRKSELYQFFNSIKYKLSLICLLFFSFGSLTSCSYQLGRGDLASSYRTISIPYVEGDMDGDLTAEIIKEISVKGGFRYVPCGGDLLLKVELLELRDENIGFRYDRKKKGELRKAIVPAETRFVTIAKVTLLDSSSHQVIRGPVRIRASVDFDHTDYSNRHGVNIFSLGQLNDIDEAYDAALRPLNRHLAENIVDYLMMSW